MRKPRIQCHFRRTTRQPREKSFGQAFSKACALKPRRLAAVRRRRNSPDGVFFCELFFCAYGIKRKVGDDFLCCYAAIISSTVGRRLVCRRCRNAIFAAQCGYNSITTSDDRWSPLQPNIDYSRKSHKICSFIMGRRGRRPLQPRIDNRRRLHQTSLFSRRQTSHRPTGL